jgi:hypothetical protein
MLNHQLQLVGEITLRQNQDQICIGRKRLEEELPLQGILRKTHWLTEFVPNLQLQLQTGLKIQGGGSHENRRSTSRWEWVRLREWPAGERDRRGSDPPAMGGRGGQRRPSESYLRGYDS